MTTAEFKSKLLDESQGNFNVLIFDDFDDIESKYQEFVDYFGDENSSHVYEDKACDLFEDVYGFSPIVSLFKSI